MYPTLVNVRDKGLRKNKIKNKPPIRLFMNNDIKNTTT